MFVDRCICRQVSFRDLKEIVDRTGAGYEALSEQTGCGTGCGMCEPYVRVMLRTGVTRLPVMTPQQCRRIIDGGRQTPGPSPQP